MVTSNFVMKLIDGLNCFPISSDIIEAVDSFFFRENEVLPSSYDMILVLASSAISRIEFAVLLYHQKKVKILISGGNLIGKTLLLEAEAFYMYAICHGVEEEDIILDLQSKNTYENFLYSFDIICKTHFVYKNIILVTNANHMPRALLTGKKVLEEKKLFYQLYPQKSISTIIRRNSWHQSIVAIDILRGELERLLKYDLIKK